ncbi:fimbrial protein [Serratia sp. PAMC26656]|uniref:fimbrial protein n=1 Tax=Serratia sp. PAMC26656 TaxID=2775909 RepID=UPI001F472AD9|nr:fimbrial protein [Serratia sp. PAMC26656]
MITVKSSQRIMFAYSLLFAAMLSAQSAQAALGQCKPAGGTHPFSFTFTPTLTNPAQNVTGLVIENAAGNNWNLSGTYDVQCECKNRTASYITAKSSLPTQTHNDGRLSYYALNEYLAVASEVYVAGYRNEYIPTPFSNVSNLKNEMGQDESCASAHYSSGARGRIHLYFRRPFVGQTIIPSTQLVETYVSVSNGVSSVIPVSTVSMSGVVTVPQNCEISPQTVVVDFGDILSTSFRTKGAMPPGFTPHQKELTLACRNISSGVKVSLSFRGEVDSNIPAALRTSNSSIGVMIEDRFGGTISPQSGRLPVDFLYPSQSGSTRFSVYPINTTGQAPAAGVFTATATIQAEME